MFELKKFHNIHKGETCIVIGNGPSLNDAPMELLNKYITFGSNKIFLLPFTPDYYCVIDGDMLKDCLAVLQNGWAPKREMFLRAEARVENNNYIYPIISSGFGMDISNFVVMGGTVSFALLQIAYFMGFETVLLVGVDHRYTKSNNDGKFGQFVASGKDPDHFVGEDGSPYFSEGKMYNRPEDTTGAYKIAEELFRKTGRKIINLTPNSQLKVFPMDVYENWIGD